MSGSSPTPASTISEPPLAGGARQRGDVLGPRLARHQIGLAALEPQHLGVLVGHDQQRQPIEPRQRVALLVALPVARVAFELDALARHVLAQDERPQPRQVRRAASSRSRRRGTCPCSSAAASLWAGRIGTPSRARRAGANGAGKREGDRLVVDDRDRGRCAAHEQVGGERAADLGIEERAKREGDVTGGERRAVGERHAVPEVERVGARVGARSHRSASAGSTSCVARLTRTRRGVGQQRHQVRRAVASDQPVQRPRFGAHGGRQRSARRRRRGRRARGTPPEQGGAAGDRHRARPNSRTRARVMVDGPVLCRASPPGRALSGASDFGYVTGGTPERVRLSGPRRDASRPSASDGRQVSDSRASPRAARQATERRGVASPVSASRPPAARTAHRPDTVRRSGTTAEAPPRRRPRAGATRCVARSLATALRASSRWTPTVPNAKSSSRRAASGKRPVPQYGRPRAKAPLRGLERGVERAQLYQPHGPRVASGARSRSTRTCRCRRWSRDHATKWANASAPEGGVNE